MVVSRERSRFALVTWSLPGLCFANAGILGPVPSDHRLTSNTNFPEECKIVLTLC